MDHQTDGAFAPGSATPMPAHKDEAPMLAGSGRSRILGMDVCRDFTSRPADASPVASFRAAIFATLGCAPEDIEPGRLVLFSTGATQDRPEGSAILFPGMLGGLFWRSISGEPFVWSLLDPCALTPAQRSAFLSDLKAAIRSIRQHAGRAK